MPRRVYDYNPELTWLNQIATIGAITLGIGQLPFIINALYSYFRGAVAPANPGRDGLARVARS